MIFTLIVASLSDFVLRFWVETPGYCHEEVLNPKYISFLVD